MFLLPRFPLGTVSVSERAKESLARLSFHHPLALLLARHACGDWGDVSTVDWAEKERGITRGDVLTSVYELRAGVGFVTFLISTSPERGHTLVTTDEDEVKL